MLSANNKRKLRELNRRLMFELLSDRERLMIERELYTLQSRLMPA